MKSNILAVDPGFGDTKVNVNGRTVKMASAIARAKSMGMAGIGMKSASHATTIQYGWETYVVPD